MNLNCRPCGASMAISEVTLNLKDDVIVAKRAKRLGG